VGESHGADYFPTNARLTEKMGNFSALSVTNDGWIMEGNCFSGEVPSETIMSAGVRFSSHRCPMTRNGWEIFGVPYFHHPRPEPEDGPLHPLGQAIKPHQGRTPDGLGNVLINLHFFNLPVFNSIGPVSAKTMAPFFSAFLSPTGVHRIRPMPFSGPDRCPP
jgi:hypothetical protein